MEIKKAIIPAAGLGTRFLPLTKVLPKEILPLAAEPMIKYVAEEAKNSYIEEIIFVISPEKKSILEYFQAAPRLERFLKTNNNKELLEALSKTEKDFEGVKFSSVVQPLPRGDGEAILRARARTGKEPFAVLFADDIFEAKIPVLTQLEKVFTTSQKAVIALKRISREKLFSYGVVSYEKIANRLYKIKGITEKPKAGEAPSDLAICGRYVLPSEVFGYLAKTPPSKKGEIVLAEALKLMIADGKIIYGYEVEGEWLECGKLSDWLMSNLYLCLKHPKYGPMLREALKKNK